MCNRLHDVESSVVHTRHFCVRRKGASGPRLRQWSGPPRPRDSSNSTLSISASVDQSGERNANNAVCAGSTKRTHFHRRIVGPDSLTRRDIRRREQRATRQKPVSRPSAYTLFPRRSRPDLVCRRSRIRENGTVLRVHRPKHEAYLTKRFHFAETISSYAISQSLDAQHRTVYSISLID